MHSDGDHTLGDILAVCGALVGNPRPTVRIPMAVARFAAHTTTPIARLFGVSPPLSPERLKLYLTSRYIDITKARTALGYEPAHQGLMEMLRPTYEDYAQTGQL